MVFDAKRWKAASASLKTRGEEGKRFEARLPSPSAHAPSASGCSISGLEQPLHSGVLASENSRIRRGNVADYRAGDDRVVVRRGGAGRTLAIIAGIILLVVILLFATGFWSANVKGGKLPEVDVSTKAGALPKVDVDSKKVVVGTKKTEVDVPVVGVKDNGEK
jgi:hypothetical protein